MNEIDNLQIYKEQALIFKKRTYQAGAGTGVHPDKISTCCKAAYVQLPKIGALQNKRGLLQQYFPLRIAQYDMRGGAIGNDHIQVK